MKRYIRAADQNSDYTQIYLDKITNLVNRSQIYNMVESVDVGYAVSSPEDETDCFIEITLKNPYKCKYYQRVDAFIDTITVIPTNDWRSVGGPELWVLIKPEDSISLGVDKLNKVASRIIDVTDRYLEPWLTPKENRTYAQKKMIAERSTDPDELAELANEAAKQIRYRVMTNRHTPKAISDALSAEFLNSSYARDREEVAWTTHDIAVLDKLINDTDKRVREAARLRLSDLDHSEEDED